MSKVKLKIIHSIGRHMAGSIVEVESEEAEQLCREITRNAGEGRVQTYQCAMELSEYQGYEEVAKATKNVVETPRDEAFEAKLAAASKTPVAAPPADDIATTGDFDPAYNEGASEPSDEDRKAAKPKKKGR